MTGEIVIKTVLDVRESAQKVKQDLTAALNSPEVQTKAREAGRKIGDALSLGIESGSRRARSAIDGVTSSVYKLAVAAGAAGLAFKAIQKAFDLDNTRVQLAAFVGGIDNANRKLAEFSRVAQSTAGVTRQSLTQAFIDLKAQAKLGEEQASRLAVSISKLQALFPKAQDTARNLAQIFSQGFELQDIKQERGQTGDFIDSVIKRLGFEGPKAVELIRKAQKAGKLTQTAYWDAVDAEVVARSANLTESLQIRMTKALESTNDKLAQLGDKLLRDVIPALDKILPYVNKLLDFFDKLPDGLKAATIGLLAFGPAIGGVTNAVIGLSGAVAGLGGFLTTPAGIAVLALLGIGTAVIGIKNAVDQIPQDVRNALNLPGDRSLIDATPTTPTRLDLPQDKRFDLGRLRKSFGLDKGQGGGGDLTDGEIRKARALRDAQLAFAKSETENELKILKDSNERQLGELKQSYEDRRITVQDYYNFTKDIQLKTLNAELQTLVQNEAQLRKNINLATGTERINIQKELNDVLTQEKLKRNEINDAIAASARALELEGRAQSARLLEQRESRRVLTRESDKELAAFRSSRLLDQRDTRRRLTRESDERGVEEFRRISRRDFNRSGAFIEEAISRGQLTGEEAEVLRQGASRQLVNNLRKELEERERLGKITDAARDDLRDEIELYDRLGTSISNTESFMRGFNSQIESTRDIFDRLGQNVARAFTNIKDLFGGLKAAVLDFFKSLLAQSLQNLVRNALGQVFSGLSGALSGIGGGAGAAGGGIGGIFRTPSTFPSLVSAFAGAAGGAGGGISAPPSISLPGLGGIIAGGTVARTAAAGGIDDFFGAGVPRTAGKIGGFSLSGFGKSIAAAAPFLGLSIGGTLGGTSTAGNILGSAGGFLAGGFAAGSLGLLGTGTAAGLLSNPFTAVIGAGLLIGGALLGKAKQRHADEEASGEMIRQALQGIEQLASGIASDQIDGSQARTIFDTQILGTFRQQISTLKTRSVVESRLKNTTRDLENVYQARIPQLVVEQQQRRANAQRNAAFDQRLVPEFAQGGVVPGIDRGRDSVLSLLRPGEIVLTRSQQQSVMMQSSPDVFTRAGVPRNAIFSGPAQAFAFGGTAQPISFTGSTDQSFVIDNLNVDLSLVVGKDDQTRIVVNGITTAQGRAATVKNVRVAQLNKEL